MTSPAAQVATAHVIGRDDPHRPEAAVLVRQYLLALPALVDDGDRATDDRALEIVDDATADVDRRRLGRAGVLLRERRGRSERSGWAWRLGGAHAPVFVGTRGRGAEGDDDARRDGQGGDGAAGCDVGALHGRAPQHDACQAPHRAFPRSCASDPMSAPVSSCPRTPGVRRITSRRSSPRSDCACAHERGIPCLMSDVVLAVKHLVEKTTTGGKDWELREAIDAVTEGLQAQGREGHHGPLSPCSARAS